MKCGGWPIASEQLQNPFNMTAPQPLAIVQQASPLAILEAAVKGGITAESVAVVKELAAMCRDQRQEDAKAAFARAFFALKNDMPHIYADKQVKTQSGAVAFTYCTPQEIQNTIDPIMRKHGFCTMTGQEKDTATGFVTATITLFHDQGHSETRSFTVRPGSGNKLMTETQCDAGATTAAERNLLIKMLGLRTRLNAEGDARNIGETIAPEKAQELEDRCLKANVDIYRFLKFAHAGKEDGSFADIKSGSLEIVEAELTRREAAAAKTSLAKENLFT